MNSKVFKLLGQNLAQSAQMFRGVFKPIGQNLAHSGHTNPYLLGSVLDQPGVLFLDLLVV